jgi:hypothetical protein
MNVTIMVDDLVDHIKKGTETLRFGTPKGVSRAPQVVDGYLPPKDPKHPDATEDFPYVIVRYLSDSSDDDGATAQVKVLCGTYCSDDRQGPRELLTLMNPLWTYLLKNRRFGKHFCIEMPVKREIPEEQPAPEWVGWFTLTIAIPMVSEEDDYVKRFFGE